MKEETFSKLQDKLMQSVSVKKDEHTELVLDLYLKVIYSYMFRHYQYFKTMGKEYFESQDSIAEALQVVDRTVGRKIKEMVSAGIIEVTKSRASKGYLKNVYIIHDVYKKPFILKDSAGTNLNVTKLPNKIKQEEDPDCPY